MLNVTFLHRRMHLEHLQSSHLFALVEPLPGNDETLNLRGSFVNLRKKQTRRNETRAAPVPTGRYTPLLWLVTL